MSKQGDRKKVRGGGGGGGDSGGDDDDDGDEGDEGDDYGSGYGAEDDEDDEDNDDSQRRFDNGTAYEAPSTRSLNVPRAAIPSTPLTKLPDYSKKYCHRSCTTWETWFKTLKPFFNAIVTT